MIEAKDLILAPHVVHVESPFEVDEDLVRTYDAQRAKAGSEPDGYDLTPARRELRVNATDASVAIVEVPETRTAYWLIESPTRRYVGPIDCPDKLCRLGLSSRGWDMICVRLGNDHPMKACHEGCVVACGAHR